MDKLTEREKKYNEETKIPKEQELSYHSIFIADIFSIDKLSDLKHGLDLIYNEDSNEYRRRHFGEYSEFLENAKTSLIGGGWINLGHVFSQKYEKSQGIVMGPVIKLPKNIDSISFMLIQRMPTYVTLSLQVQLENKVSEELVKVFSKTYKEQKEPIKLGHKIYSPDKVKKLAVQKFLDGINIELEHYLATKFQGIFLAEQGNNLRCPFIRLMSLSKIPVADDKGLAKWLEANRFFLGTFNIVPISWLCYKFKEYFIFETEDKSTPSLLALTSKDSFENQEKRLGYYSAEIAIAYMYDVAFLNCLNLLCLSNLVNKKLKKVAAIRAKVLSKQRVINIKQPKIILKEFKDDINELSDFTEQAFNINRLVQELEVFIAENKLLYREIPEFYSIEERRKKDNKHYFEYVIDSLNWKRKTLSQELLFLTDLFKVKFSIHKNMADFKTQKQILNLTFWLVVLTVVLIGLTIYLLMGQSKG